MKINRIYKMKPFIKQDDCFNFTDNVVADIPKEIEVSNESWVIKVITHDYNNIKIFDQVIFDSIQLQLLDYNSIRHIYLEIILY